MKIKTQVIFIALAAMSGAAFAGQGSAGGAIGGSGSKAGKLPNGGGGIGNFAPGTKPRAGLLGEGTGKKGGGGNFAPGTNPCSKPKLASGGAGTGPEHSTHLNLGGGVGIGHLPKGNYAFNLGTTTRGGKTGGGSNG